MKRFVAVLSGLLVLPAFADTVRDTVQPIAQPSSVASRSGATGRGAARVSSSVRGSSDPSARNVNARTVATSRNATQARTGVKSREVATSPRTTTTNNARVAQRTGTSARTATNITSVATNVRRNTTTNTGRAVTTNAHAGVRSGITARASTVSANTNVADTTTTISQMDNLTQMTDYCKAQYTSCMDNYCNVLDDNQGRCTCSKNIKNYEKTEKALKEANEALQDVAQQIQYIGLTADEIETLFSQTEAEIQMQATNDNSQLKNSLDSIRDLIVDVKSGTATTTDTGMSFDLSGLLDFNIGDAGFDLSAIFGSNNTNTNSISNQRGEQLYKTASARCKASVLNTCQNQGVDISVITNAYDMEIDKQCIAYERSLNEANNNMNNTVRNAKTVLQKARLMVSQQKNAYDLRGCVNALDSCMQDEFVCGSDYENCLDPTGKYIVNGEIVAGSMPGLAVAGSSIDAPTSDLTQSGLYKTWNYDDGGTEVNAWNQDGSLAEYINATVKKNSKPSDTSSIMSEYLMAKIGYIDGNRTYGMCSAVLNKCRMHTFDTNDTYQFDNTVVKEYLARTMTKIKAKQDEILADYAGGCMVDIETCLGKNSYGTNDGTYSNAAINACRSQIITCMSVNGDTTKEPNPAAIKAWIEAAYNNKETENPGGSDGSDSSDDETPGESEAENCIMISLANKDGNITRTIYQNVNKEFIFYTDDKCTNSATMTESDPTGYTFDGYYTKNDFSTQCTDEYGNFVGSTKNACKPTSDTTWYGKYTADTPAEPEVTCYKITLDPQGGTGGATHIYKSNSTTLYSDSTCTTVLSTVTTPSNPGYTFDGYYNVSTYPYANCINANGGFSYDMTNCNPTSTTTWYAKYTATSCYKITLDKNGGTGGTQYVYKNTYKPTVLYADSQCTVSTTITYPTKTNHTFAGYINNKSAISPVTCIEADGDISTTTDCTPTSDTTWYGVWTPTQTETCAMISLVVGTGSGGTTTVYKGSVDSSVLYTDAACTTSTTTITSPTPATGSTFNGYYSANDFSIQCIDSTGKFVGKEKTACDPDSNTSWYAKYDNCVNIHLVVGYNSDAVGGTREIYKKHGYTALYSDNTCTTILNNFTAPTRSGYTFIGYNIGPTDTAPQCLKADGSFTFDMTNCNPSKTVSWYPRYTKNTPAETCAEITLNKGAGSGGMSKIYKSSKSSTYLYSDAECTDSATPITTPTRYGSTFDGYYSSGDFNTQCINSTGYFVGDSYSACNPTDSATWYAKYK